MKKNVLLYPLILFSLLFTIPTLGYSQYYSSGQDPASLKWNQINSSNFQVIYPRGYDSVAQYIMNVMEYGRELTLKTKEVEPKKVSIIIHNQTIISNAEVAWAPSRMEVYTVTPQATYSQPWIEQLALHEYTHVLQISNIRQGFSKFLSYFFGEQITVGIFGLYIPYWFAEGDAVVNETAFSKSGRGRDPNFEAEVRAQIVEKGAYSLEKASLGSYKDFTPDRYHIGYYLVGQGKVEFGKDMWKKPLRNVARSPLGIVPFAKGIRKRTGLTKLEYYRHTTRNLKSEWIKQLVKTKAESLNLIIENESYTNYTNTSFISENEIFSLKKDFHGVGQFVILDTLGNEQILHTPGIYFDDYISIGGDFLCWSEYQFDPRWSHRSYVKVLKMNLKTHKIETVIDKTRYFSASISPSGSKIAAVEVDDLSQHFLVIFSAENGQIIKKIASPDNDFIAHPAWSPNENKIVAEVLNEYGKGIAIIDIDKEQFLNILPYGHVHLQYPSFWKNYVLFEAAYSGVMDVFALDIKTKSIFQTTETEYSASDYCLSPDSKNMVFSSYSAMGKQMVMKAWGKKNWRPISEVRNNAYPLADMLSKQEDTILNPDFIPRKKYEIKKYNKLANAINIHSWSFFTAGDEGNGLSPGIRLLSQNKLATLQARVGAHYDIFTTDTRYYAAVDYLGWYPVMSLGSNFTQRHLTQVHGNDTNTYRYDEFNINLSFYLPLTYTSGNWVYRVQPGIGLNLKSLDNLDVGLSVDYPDIKSGFYYLSTSGTQKSPSQNIFPRLGYNLSMAYYHTPLQSELGDMLSLGLAGYLPGLMRHDGQRIMLNYQLQNGDADFYTKSSNPPRGYVDLPYNELFTLRYDYKVPILYPDLNISSLFYFKRVTFGVFGDYSILPNRKATASYPDNNFWSAGGELTTDFHFLRMKFPIEMGIRASYVNGYIMNPKGITYELLYGIGI